MCFKATVTPTDIYCAGRFVLKFGCGLGAISSANILAIQWMCLSDIWTTVCVVQLAMEGVRASELTVKTFIGTYGMFYNT